MSDPEKDRRKKRNRRRKIRRMAVAAILLAVIGLIGFLTIRKLQRNYTVTYDAYTTAVGTISNSMNYSGNMQLIHNKTYAAGETAKIREVYVAAGDSVKEGDRLMRLSSGETLKADFDGTVNKIEVEKGDEVTKDTPLVQVADFSRMQVSFRVGESDISQVYPGQAIRVTVASANVSFESEILNIDYASYSGNNVAYYTATAEVDTSGSKGIYPGMQATVTIPKEEVRDVVILKMDAVSTARDNSAFVYLMEEDGTMREQAISVGVSNGNYVEVKEGLSEGQTVYAVAEAEEETSLLAQLFGSQQVNTPGSRGGQSNNGGRNGGSTGERPSGGYSPNR